MLLPLASSTLFNNNVESVPVVITEWVYEAGCKEIWNENIIIIVVIMGQIFLLTPSAPLISKYNNIFTFTQNITTLNKLASENICQAHVTASNNCTRGFLMLPSLGLFLPVLVAINRIVHACSLLSPEWQKKSTWGTKKKQLRGDDDENGNFSASKHNWNRNTFIVKRLLFFLCVVDCHQIHRGIDFELNQPTTSTMPFGFFGRFHFYCSMLARRAKIAVRCFSIMLAMYQQIDGIENNKNRVFSGMFGRCSTFFLFFHFRQ